MKTLIFVYGTLLQGEGNHRLLKGVAACLGRVRTEPRYTLVSLGRFPGMLEGGEDIVEGEVYSVDKPTLGRLDGLEGHPSFYERKAVAIQGFEDRIEAYFLPRNPYEKNPRIVSGSWRDQEARRCPNCKRLVTEKEIARGEKAHHGELKLNPDAFCVRSAE